MLCAVKYFFDSGGDDYFSVDQHMSKCSLEVAVIGVEKSLFTTASKGLLFIRVSLLRCKDT